MKQWESENSLFETWRVQVRAMTKADFTKCHKLVQHGNSNDICIGAALSMLKGNFIIWTSILLPQPAPRSRLQIEPDSIRPNPGGKYTFCTNPRIALLFCILRPPTLCTPSRAGHTQASCEVGSHAVQEWFGGVVGNARDGIRDCTIAFLNVLNAVHYIRRSTFLTL